MSMKLLFVAVALALAAPVSAEVIAELDHIRDGELLMVGFDLSKGSEIDIEAVGIRPPHRYRLSTYAWLIDHETRNVVWSMTSSNSSRASHGRSLCKAEGTKFLEPGKYELYMYASGWRNGSIIIDGGKDFLDLLEDLAGGDDKDYDLDWGYDLDECYVRVSSDELKAADVKQFEITGGLPGALISFVSLGDDEYVHQAFTLDEPMNLRIYALVEHPSGNRTPVDYGWIINSATRERVWEIDRFNSERAGGGRKNRVFNDEIRLDKGSYVLYYVTDDSHSWDGFNIEPPDDPVNWGISLLPGKDFKPASFHLVEVTDERGKPLVDFTRARDNEYFEQVFELTKPATVRVYAIGEYSDGDHEFVDYGWIEDASTGDAVWEMTRRNTDHAGGGEKNRMFDGSVELKAGRYVAIYVTDDSHSYRDWNTGRPYDEKAYGMAIYPGEGFDQSTFALIRDRDVFAGTSLLARITAVRDREHRRESFVLDKDTRVKIYALGEGQDRRMYDYGWIENANTGRTVWEMTYRKTRHAGGADKNRECNDTILLEAGEYEVYYETDGSHSFGDWNAAAPRHPKDWGITVSLADEMANR
jgi:hypothetical protein